MKGLSLVGLRSATDHTDSIGAFDSLSTKSLARKVPSVELQARPVSPSPSTSSS